MKSLKLYNWYGHEFDPIIPDIFRHAKDYKRQAYTTFELAKNKIDLIRKNDKDLFLKAKHKILQNQKRQLQTLKISYQSEAKKIKETIKQLSYAENFTKLLNYNLNFVHKKRKETAIYLKDFCYSLNFTQDDASKKSEMIDNAYIIAQKEESSWLVQEIHLKILKKLNYKQLLNNINLTNVEKLSLSIQEREYIHGHAFEIDQLCNLKIALEKSQQKLLLKKDELLKEYNDNKKFYYQKYLEEKQVIKDETTKRILEAEYSFNINYQNHLNQYKNVYQNEKLEIKKNSSYLERETKEQQKKFKQKILKLKINERKNKFNFFKLNLKLIQSFHIINKLYTLAFFKKYYNFQTAYDLNTLFKIEDLIDNKNYASIKNLLLEIKHNHQLAMIFLKTLNNKDQKIIKNFLNSRFMFLVNFERFFINLEKFKVKFYLINSESKKNYTYDGLFLAKKAIYLKEKIENLNIEIDKFVDEKFSNLKTLYDLKIGGGNKKEKIIYDDKKNLLKSEYKKEIKETKILLFNKLISKKAFFNKIRHLKVVYKKSCESYKLEGEYQKTKFIDKSILIRFWSRTKIIKKIYESKVTELNKLFPLETKYQFRWLAVFLNLIMPGLSELIFFKQWKKGTLLFSISAILIALIVPFSFGYYWTQSGGILGLIDLGASKHDYYSGIFTDARYYLFGGILSAMLLTFLFSYNIANAISAYRVSTSMYHGTRPSNWSYTKRWLSQQGFPWLISLPGWILIAFIVIAPILTSLLLSFTNIGFNHEPPGRIVDWIGLNQYGKWWLFRDIGMIESLSRVLGWTIAWTLFSAFSVIVVGTLFAVLLNTERIKGKKFFRLIYIIPWAIPAFVTIIFLKSAFQPDPNSLVNLILLKLNLVNEPINWWSNVHIIRVLLIIIQTWLGHSYIFLLVTGNLQSIPKDIYEAGSIDGANKMTMFWKLTVPALLAAIAPLLITQFTFSFNNFAIISLFSDGGPQYTNPTPFLEGGTDILISWVFKLTNSVGQIDGNVGFASAMTMLAAVLSISFGAYGFVKSIARKEFN